MSVTAFGKFVLVAEVIKDTKQELVFTTGNPELIKVRIVSKGDNKIDGNYAYVYGSDITKLPQIKTADTVLYVVRVDDIMAISND